MRDTGYVRRLDRLGRIVIPKKLLDRLNIDQNTPLEIYTEDGDIKIRPYIRECAICGGPAGSDAHMGRSVCENCKKALQEQLKEVKQP